MKDHQVHLVENCDHQYAEAALGNREFLPNKPKALVVGGTTTSPDCSELAGSK